MTELTDIFNQNFIDPDTNLLLNQITSYTTKTVGSGKDFETFQEAMEWASNQSFTGPGSLVLLLDDGIHECGPVSTAPNYSFYTLINSYIEIKSASGDKNLCKLTVKPTGIYDYYYIFDAHNTSLRLENITLDLALGGNTTVTEMYPILGYDGSNLQIISCYIKGGYTSLYIDSSKVDIYKCTFENKEVGVTIAKLGQLYEYGGGTASTFLNNSVGLNVNSGGVASINANSVFTGNTTDTNIPMNEIQYDTSLITNRTTALSFKV